VKFKWYIGALLAMISYFVVEQQSTDVPNQEIVFTFSQVDGAVEYQKALASIKKQLLRIGAENVAVTEVSNGSLRVTYYSSLDLQNVKDHLFISGEKDGFATSLKFKNKTSGFPMKDSLVDYQIDIYEISEDVSSGMDHEGKSYFELKQDYSRGSQVHFSFLTPISSLVSDQLVIVAQKVREQVVFTFNTSSFNIPEVRAGPFS
jgi:hypothetical protein